MRGKAAQNFVFAPPIPKPFLRPCTSTTTTSDAAGTSTTAADIDITTATTTATTNVLLLIIISAPHRLIHYQSRAIRPLSLYISLIMTYSLEITSFLMYTQQCRLIIPKRNSISINVVTGSLFPHDFQISRKPNLSNGY